MREQFFQVTIRAVASRLIAYRGALHSFEIPAKSRLLILAGARQQVGPLSAGVYRESKRSLFAPHDLGNDLVTGHLPRRGVYVPDTS